MNVQIKNHLLYIDGKQVPYYDTPHKGGIITPKYGIIHYTADGSIGQATSWFMNKDAKVSAHLVNGRNGEVHQFAPFNMKCWHAGESSWHGLVGLNSHSIGIELTNMGRSSVPKEGYISATHKNESKPAYWQPYTCKQIEVTTAIVSALRVTYGLVDVIGHDDIAPQRKTDPGPAFDMVKLREQAGFTSNVKYTTTADLNVRSKAGTGNPIVTVLPKGTQVEYLGSENDWYKIKSNGITGWVSSKYLR